MTKTWFVFILAAAAAASVSCARKADFDIAEIAPAEHLGEADIHGHSGEEAHGHDHGAAGETETGMHIHPAGSRNHGTQWFFNQPWAAPFVWGKMLRDTLVLAALSVTLAVSSSRRRSRRR
ncbi:hypothetical protein GX411_03380 [Candidatus Fermentibacteria bacterium]|nr:hypothetical protein [Candidatus Fermentibacteria bacterium]